MAMSDFDKWFEQHEELFNDSFLERKGLARLAWGAGQEAVQLRVNADTATPCPFCDGMGEAIYTSDFETCHVCNGTGKA